MAFERWPHLPKSICSLIQKFLLSIYYALCVGDLAKRNTKTRASVELAFHRVEADTKERSKVYSIKRTVSVMKEKSKKRGQGGERGCRGVVILSGVVRETLNEVIRVGTQKERGE